MCRSASPSELDDTLSLAWLVVDFMWNVAFLTSLHRTQVSECKTVPSIEDNTTKFCTFFLVVHPVLHLPLSVLWVFL